MRKSVRLSTQRPTLWTLGECSEVTERRVLVGLLSYREKLAKIREDFWYARVDSNHRPFAPEAGTHEES